MQYFNEKMFNPNYFSNDFYQANYDMIQQNYNKEQAVHVAKAVKAFKDMMDEVQYMDNDHQAQAFSLCLLEMASRNGWSNGTSLLSDIGTV